MLNSEMPTAQAEAAHNINTEITVTEAPKKRGRKATEVNPLEKDVVELKRALAKAELRAKRAEALVELQKKVSELLGIQLPTPEDEKP